MWVCVCVECPLCLHVGCTLEFALVSFFFPHSHRAQPPRRVVGRSLFLSLFPRLPKVLLRQRSSASASILNLQ